jgi:transposase
MFSLIEITRPNGHNPQRYLTGVLRALPNAGSIEELESLLPWNLTPNQIDTRYALYPKP